MSELCYKTIAELKDLLDGKAVSAIELMQAFIDRTDAVDDRVQAFLSRDVDDALQQARDSDTRRAENRLLGPLDGIPVGIKDLIAVKDQPLTCASKILANYRSPYDATVSTKLKEAGAVLWGRLNMDEFAMGSSTENSAMQKTANPWDLDCVPGGSSGGSAACVAAGEAVAALGSDTGGSIRQPAAFCGIVGLKPTYGLVSRYGLAAFASSLDQIGPMTRSVADAAQLLQVIAGKDERDSTSVGIALPDYIHALKEGKKTWTFGVPEEFFGEGIDPAVRQAVEQAIAFYEQAGGKRVAVSLPHTELAIPVYYIIATAEASSNLARYDGIRYTHRSEQAKDHVDLYFQSRGEGFGREVKRRIILGTYALSSGYYDAYYLRAQKVRNLIRQDLTQAFEQVDAVITPTTPTPAFRFGEKAANPLEMYLSDIFTISVNLAGLPAISLPCGWTEEGLPIGFQLIGKPFDEANLLAMADHFEQAHDYAQRRPSL